jgi:serine kinase of HPr protein (carbohydrate metabolism regulator)
MTQLSSETLHASCVAIGNAAILIEGLSGSGKSDLALRLIDRGATLVSDDYTCVRRAGTQAIASPAPNIGGLLEVRGLGLLRFSHISDVVIAMIVSLDAKTERLPEARAVRIIAGISLPVFPLTPFEASAPVKVELALKGLSAA